MLHSTILSLQSHVAYGSVGNAAAVPALECLGFPVWAAPTTLLAHHPGHGDWRGEFVAPALVATMLTGVKDLGKLGSCAAMLTGYLGTADTGQAGLDFLAHLRAANPDALYLLDPVMGDRGRLYVKAEMPGFFIRASHEADIITPNRFELSLLTDERLANDASVMRALSEIRYRMRPQGPRLALTSILDKDKEEARVLLMGDFGAALVTTPLLPIDANGAGDLLSALFLGYFLKTKNPIAALENAVSGVFAIIKATQESGVDELALIENLAYLSDPPRRFSAQLLT